MMLTLGVAARKAGVSKRTMQRWVRKGLPTFGRPPMVSESDLAEWTQLRTNSASQPASRPKPLQPKFWPEYDDPAPEPVTSERAEEILPQRNPMPGPARPLDGIITNEPHEMSSNWPTPQAYREWLEREAEIEKQNFRRGK